MPTSPLSSSLVTKLKAATAWRFNAQLGPTFSPRFFCCDSPNSMGLSEGKEPVAVINLSPNPALVGETVSYDGTDSYDPDGSITGYAWSFEDHTPASGTASAGTLNYATAGTFTVELVVTDGTGLKSLPAREELVVQPPSFAGYIAASNGVYYSDGTALAWDDKNSGLSGNDLITYSIAIDPATQQAPESNKVVWRCGENNIYISADGGGNWAAKLPGTVTNDWSDSPAPEPGSLTYRDLLFVDDRLFTLATWQNSSDAWRSWLFYTDNAADVRTEGTAATVTWNQVGVAYLLPVADGNYTGFTAFGAAADWQCVDDPVGGPDDGTTYVRHTGTTSPTRESFILAAYEYSDTIGSVTIAARVDLSATADGTIALFLRIDGTDYDGDNQTLVRTGGYIDYTATWTTNPDTSAAWIAANLAALEAGVIITNPGITSTALLTQLYATVIYS